MEQRKHLNDSASGGKKECELKLNRARGIKNNRTTQGNIRSKRLRITRMNSNISLCETIAEQTVPLVSIKDIY